MADAVGGAGSAGATGFGGGGADSGASASQGSDGVGSVGACSAGATADTSGKSGSGADSSAAAAAACASQTDALSAPAAGNQLGTAPTTEDQLKSSTTTGSALTDTDDENVFSRSVTGFRTDDGSLTLGSASFEASAPGVSVDREAGKAKASLGSIAVDVTALQAQSNIELGPVAIDGTVTVGTINAQAEAGIKGSLAERSVTAKAAVGAEAMAIEATVKGEISITGKTIADTLGGVYNQVVDPVVDYIAGEDMPDIPEAPASWDHGITLGGHVTGGWGASAKTSAGASFSPTNGAKIGVSGKLGWGPTVGLGITLGAK